MSTKALFPFRELLEDGNTSLTTMKETPNVGAQDITQSTGLPEPPLGPEISQQPTPWSKWYEKDHTTDTSLIEPADKVRDSKEEFLRAAKLSSEEKNILEKTATIEDFVSITNKAQEKWKGKKGAKARDAIQRTVSDWSQLANNYKSTVDALKSVSPEFGGIAWGTIGIVVAVIINKHKKEQALDRSIRQISQSLPRLDLYCMLYPTRRMQECVANLYAKVMEFLQRAYIYYRRPGWTRVLSAFSNPVEISIQPVVDDITALSQTIKDEGTVALAAEIRDVRATINNVKTTIGAVQNRVEKISRDLGKTTSQVDELKDILEDSETLQARDDLKRIKHLFADKNYDPNLQYQSVKQILAAIPRKTSEIQYCMGLRDRDSIRQWRHRILWLARLPGSIVPPIWLSHFALERYENLQPEYQLVIHSSCIHGSYPSTTVKLLLRHFIYQTLSWKPQLLRNRRDLEEFRSSDIEPTLSQLWGLASNLMPTDTRVYWIIDRLDECKFSRGGEERFDRVYEKLKNLVQYPRELRILVTSACLPATLDRVSGEDLRSEDVCELVAEI